MYRDDFPFFKNNSLVYLDSGATTQKPQTMIDRVTEYYTYENCNIGRGNYSLSLHTNRSYEEVRTQVAGWIQAEPGEIIFTKSCTEAINLAAYTFCRRYLSSRENIAVTELEHSSDYFPWKQQCRERGAEFRVVKGKEDGSLDWGDLTEKVDQHTRLLAITAMSNVTGYRPELPEIIAFAHARGCKVLIDATQEIVHHEIDVKALDCDFLAFSAHKLYGPTGVGILYIRRQEEEELAPFLYGGGMVVRDTQDSYSYRTDFRKFEAGTQNIAGVIAFGETIGYLNQIGLQNMIRYESKLAAYLNRRLQDIPGIRIAGQVENSPIVSFEIDGLSAYDAGIMLSARGIAVRAGAHCAYPLLHRMGKESLVRISLGMYNTAEDIDKLAEQLHAISKTGRRCAIIRGDGDG